MKDDGHATIGDLDERQEPEFDEGKPSAQTKFKRSKFISLLTQGHPICATLLDNPLLKLSVSYANPFYCERFDGTNIFGLSQNALKEIITQITEYVFKLDKSKFITESNNEVEINCLREIFIFGLEKLNLTIENFTIKNCKEDKLTKESACLAIIPFIVALRATLEIRRANVQLRKVSLEDAKSDWASIAGYKSTAKTLYNLSMIDSTGKKAADYFTLPFRNKAASVAPRFKSEVEGYSPFEILCGNKPHTLASIIRRRFREMLIAAIKSQLGFMHADLTLTSNMFYKAIRRDAQIGQFPPTLVHDIISCLKNTYEFHFPITQSGEPNGAMLDPCAGWGGREIAALSHPDIVTYTGVDPNPELTSSYHDMHEMWDPAQKKKAAIFCKKIEDVTPQELRLGRGQSYQLIFTSPPYGVEHYYKGQTNYGADENLKALFAGITQKAEVLDDGGFMVINFGIIGSIKKVVRNLPQIFADFIKNHAGFISSQLSLVAEPIVLMSKDRIGQGEGGYSGKEHLIVARKIANMGGILQPIKATFLPEDKMEESPPESDLEANDGEIVTQGIKHSRDVDVLEMERPTAIKKQRLIPVHPPVPTFAQLFTSVQVAEEELQVKNPILKPF